MKKLNLILSVSLLFVLFSSFVIVEKDKSKVDKKTSARLEKIINRYQPALAALNYDLDAFVKLTPSKYRHLTGKRLGLIESIELRQIQKAVKKSMNPAAEGGGIPKWAYILLVILGLGFIPIGIMSDWTGNDWWINILLTLCFWIPGVIHGLIVMKKYY